MAVAQKALAPGLDDRRARESLGWRVLDWLDLQGLGLDGIEWITSPQWALVSLIIVGIWHHTPFMTLILLAGLQSLPQDPFEAARIDGASRWQMLIHITLPLLKTHIMVALILRSIFEVKEFDTILAITDGRAPLRERDHEPQHLLQRLRVPVHGRGGGEGGVVLLPVHPVRAVDPGEAPEAQMVLLMKRLLPRRTYEILEAIGTQVVMIAVVAPFFFIHSSTCSGTRSSPTTSSSSRGSGSSSRSGRTTPTYSSTATSFPNIVDSLIISTATTLIRLACGLLTAYTVARYNLRKLAMAILVTRMIPCITARVPFRIVYKQVGLLNTHAGIILSHLVITIPFGVWIMMGFIEDIPKDLEEAAWIDGASRTQAFLRIVLPLSTPGMVATAILCFMEQLPARPGARGIRREHRAGVRIQVRGPRGGR